MAATATVPLTLQKVLNDSNASLLANAMQKMKFGDMNAPLKVVFAGLTASATLDVTTAAAKAAATISGISLEAGENLPAILDAKSLRVTAGAAAAGQRAVSDSGAAASATLATLSDDGKTLTFEGTVTACVLIYQPRSRVDLGADFAPQPA